jgi:hypothetical protein
MKGNLRSPEDAKPMEGLLQLFPSIRMTASFSSSFFKGFPNPLWLPYLDNDNLTLPCEFSFETGRQDGRFLEIFNILIHPCSLPAEFSGGRLNHSTYEYYQPNMVARQLGCGQMPPRLFLHEFLKPREEIKENAQSRRVFQYECSPTIYAWPFTPTTVAHPPSTLGGKNSMTIFSVSQCTHFV